ncbi:MAG TPA: hypothetical protein VLN73_03025 [Alphaproteobacteria bacterium]|nr:hypothetical protein [Alphaproteobacteria bacterium]
MWKAPLILASVLILVLTSGCADDEEAAASKASSTQQAVDDSAASRGDLPRISVSADKTHAVQPGDEITVSISVSGFRLAPDRIGQANEPGVGHYRIYLNQIGGEDFLAEGAAPNIKITLPSDITDGSHELIVALYNNDRTPVSPAVDAGVLLIVYRL